MKASKFLPAVSLWDSTGRPVPKSAHGLSETGGGGGGRRFAADRTRSDNICVQMRGGCMVECKLEVVQGDVPNLLS